MNKKLPLILLKGRKSRIYKNHKSSQFWLISRLFFTNSMHTRCSLSGLQHNCTYYFTTCKINLRDKDDYHVWFTPKRGSTAMNASLWTFQCVICSEGRERAKERESTKGKERKSPDSVRCALKLQAVLTGKNTSTRIQLYSPAVQ